MKLLIVVDYQKDFVDGSLGFPGAEALEGPIAAKIKEYRLRDDHVVFTLDTHEENYMDTQEGKNLPIPHCIDGTAGHALYGKIAGLVREGDKYFFKETFGSEDLFDFLREQRGQYESIELVGLVSNICVISNAVLAKTAQPETPVLVDAACTGSGNGELNAAALAVMEGLQIAVLNR